jgi:hypothetical protein
MFDTKALHEAEAKASAQDEMTGMPAAINLPVQYKGVDRRRRNMNIYKKNQKKSHGCHSLPVAGYYWMDVPFRRQIIGASKTGEGVDAWMNEWRY